MRDYGERKNVEGRDTDREEEGRRRREEDRKEGRKGGRKKKKEREKGIAEVLGGGINKT